MAFRVLIIGNLRDGVTVGSYREFAARTTALVAAEEPGTTLYNWWVGEDGTVIAEDGFADEAAYAAHMRHMYESGLKNELMSLIDVKSVQVLGEVNAAGREGLTPLRAVHFSLASSR